MSDLILKKRNGASLTQQEIEYVVNGYTGEQIPDYQISALLMAIYYKGMSTQEVSDLTMSMVHSGDTIDLSKVHGMKVDKHSTGGVGDKVSLIVAPLVAAVGVPVAKMSGRGLGHTGGTIDKLEAIEGFSVELTREEFFEQVNTKKLAIIGQSGRLTPADKKLYALRDVTATVDSIPLIASSIMSKKIASGADAIVLDVKTGSGAFMKSLDGAKDLAQTMVQIGKSLGRKTIAIISDMNQPLGYEIGNANEIKEAIEVLQGKRVEDLREVSLSIAAHMAVLGGVYEQFEEAYKQLEHILDSGEALETFKSFVDAQGGNVEQIIDPAKLPKAKFQIEITSDAEGYVEKLEAEPVGVAAMLLGAGRKTKDDQIDHSVGITLKKKIGDYVQKGDVLAIFHSNTEDVKASIDSFKGAISLTAQKIDSTPMIYETIE
ncbi:pyrimidine-nucleoside phosphorylase [Bacillus horti]|uniref:Pyrimidine-nucleoside phosphorylase n=2 Tax=Caldalkalibacillus horti TaxID=77523 RepID=A0ABT9VU70_9BACI|nr:pyrimidine-nucleoside phosphorylase [Bacillus horti]